MHVMPDTRFPRASAMLIALFVGCIFYGIYLVTFVTSLRCVLRSRTERPWKLRIKHQRWTLAVLLLMFTFSTLNVALGLVRVIQGFVYNVRIGGAADEQLGQNWVNMVKGLTLNFQILTADVVLIYRCWIIYGRSLRVVVFPILMWWGAIACVVVSTYMEGAMSSGSKIDIAALIPVSIFTWLATLALNLYATTMIVLRIRHVVDGDEATRERSSPLYHPLERIMRIIVESGLIYALASVIFFITLVAESNSLFLTAAAEVQIVGIAFNLILIRARNSTGSDSTGSIDTSDYVITFTSRTDTANHDSGKHRLVIYAPGDAEENNGTLNGSTDIGTRHSC